MAKTTIATGSTVIQPYRRDWSPEGRRPPPHLVTYEVEYDNAGVVELLRDAFANKSGSAKRGPITVRITSKKEA